MKEDITKIAGRFLKIRKDSGYNQSDFANQLGITQSSISTIEIGINDNPTFQTLCAICKQFGIRSQWLLFGEGEMYINKENQDANLLELIDYQKKEIAHIKQQLQDSQKTLFQVAN